MADSTANLGLTKTVSIYVEDKKLGRDFKQIVDFTWKKTYKEGEDAYLGKTKAKPWQVPTGSSGSFNIEESDAAYCGQIDEAIALAEMDGQRPKIVIVERTANNGGTTAKVTFADVTMQTDHKTSGKFDKVMRTYTFRASVPKEE